MYRLLEKVVWMVVVILILLVGILALDFYERAKSPDADRLISSTILFTKEIIAKERRFSSYGVEYIVTKENEETEKEN